MLRLYLLGPPKIEYQNKLIHLQRQKALALLAYLALAGEPRYRHELAALLWPEASDSKALASLRRVLAALRQTLGHEAFTCNYSTVGLVLEHLWVDVGQFQAHFALCNPPDPSQKMGGAACLPLLVETMGLVRGDFMAGFSLRDAVPFDIWQSQHAIQLRQQIHRALEQLICGFTEMEDYPTAIQYAHQWLDMEPYHEHGHQRLMRLYTLNGQRDLALQQYLHWKQRLANEFNLPPDEETTAIYHTILSDSSKFHRNADQ